MSIADAIGRALARVLEATGGADRIRAHYVAEYGVCASCARPLAGAAPSQFCESCHASQVLAGLGGSGGGDA